MSEQPKACPLMSQVVMKPGALGPQAGLINFNCIEEKCAWWDKSEKQCAVVSTASWTRRGYIADNMDPGAPKT